MGVSNGEQFTHHFEVAVLSQTADGLAISLLTRLFLYKLYMNLLLRNIPEYVFRTLYLYNSDL